MASHCAARRWLLSSCLSIWWGLIPISYSGSFPLSASALWPSDGDLWKNAPNWLFVRLPAPWSIVTMTSVAGSLRGREPGFRWSCGTDAREIRSKWRASEAALMGLPHQTITLLKAARRLMAELPADAVLLLTE